MSLEQKGEQEFMSDLFADLDATDFDFLPSSPAPARSTPAVLKRTPLAVKAPNVPGNSIDSIRDPSRQPVLSFWNSVNQNGLERILQVSGAASASQKGSSERYASTTYPSYTQVDVSIETDKKENSYHVPIKQHRWKGKERQRDTEDDLDLVNKRIKCNSSEHSQFRGSIVDSNRQHKNELLQANAEEKPLCMQYTRCTVQSILEAMHPSGFCTSITLEVSLEGIDTLYKVVLIDDWVETVITRGDIVHLIGTFDKGQVPSITINRQENLLILHPDILVSSTKVADSSHCARKALLQEIIRTSTSSSTASASTALVYGNMLHELLQYCMVTGRFDAEVRASKLDEIAKRDIGTLWTLGIEVETAKQALIERSTTLEQFSETYHKQTPGPLAFLSDNRLKTQSRARLAIRDTLDIEEDIWSPRFGLKGKIDVSVSSVIVEGTSTGGTAFTMPFEIKTGRTHAGMEHRAQTMLYTLLMSDRIDSGLLFYSQSNEVHHVPAARNELRGLIQARNRLAHFLSKRKTIGKTPRLPLSALRTSTTLQSSKAGVADAVQFTDMEDMENILPSPIDEARSCARCYVKDACMIYRKAVEGNIMISADKDAPLQILYEELTGHLTATHTAFFKKWERLISLEEQEMTRFKQEIWTMSAEERMKHGRCMANMVVDSSFETSTNHKGTPSPIHQYTYRLKTASSTLPTMKSDRLSTLLGGAFAVNDPVLVSLEQPKKILALARGFVLEISPYHVILGLDHSLTENPQANRTTNQADVDRLVFRIDKDELATGMGRIRDNLIQLFAVNGDIRRRHLIVDLQPPAFLPSEARYPSIFKDLNSDQEAAVSKILSCQDYTLLLGMPGTGKTTAIARAIQSLAQAGKSILLTAHTHSAVDNILLKLRGCGLEILRLGNVDKIMPAICEYSLAYKEKTKTVSQYKKQMMAPQVVATTCLGINEPLFSHRQFDVCIIDEASQVTLPTCLGPLRLADRFVLVGDHNQLPPLVRSQEAREGGLDTSLFKILSDAHPSAVAHLSQQYRMNDDIMLISNTLVYNHQLRPGSVEIAERTLHLPHHHLLRNWLTSSAPNSLMWLQEILREHHKVIFVNTDNLPSAQEQKNGSLIENHMEAYLAVQTVKALLLCGINANMIGILAPYRQQIKLISHCLRHQDIDVEVLTADRSQGRDKDCIIMSLTRSNTNQQVGDLLQDWRRMNVSFTRAKQKLILFGSYSTLKESAVLASFFALAAERNWMYDLPAESGVDFVVPSLFEQ